MLVLWVDSECVVIGRHQNPWVECDIIKMEADDVPLVRRVSGGGAVYHDPGNSNFSFIAPAAEYDQATHVEILLSALRALGIDATANDRNDLLLHGRKFSGSAYRHSRGHSLHHGTLLVHANLDRLLAYLRGSATQITSKATQSVRSRVINLNEASSSITHSAVWDALEAAWLDRFSYSHATPPGVDPLATLISDAAQEIDSRAAELREWSWVYGHSPPFKDRGTSGGQSVEVLVRRGHIEEVRGEVDESVRARLQGAPYDPRLLQGD